MPEFNRRRLAAPFIAAMALGATACSPIVSIDPAPNAAHPACASVMVSLPVEVASNALRETNSQATAAWGEPSRVVLRCGVEVPGPTTDACASVNGIDWIIREGDGTWTATTYGRDPAVEVLFNPDQVASSTVLVELGDPVSRITQTRECVGLADVTELPSGG